MRSLIACLFAVEIIVAACGGPQAKPKEPGNEGSAVPENCCCKSSQATSEDGKPVYEMINRMECSTKQGECVDDVQCNAAQTKPAAE